MKAAILGLALTLTVGLTYLVTIGAKVEVPPAHIGKILTKNGYAPESVPPSKFRLPACWAYCDRLVLLEVSDSGLMERLTVFMPHDRLNLTVEVRGTFSIPSDKATLDTLFNRMVAEGSETIGRIPAPKVYATYGKQAVRGIVRSEITKYTIQDVMQNRESIGANIHAAIAAKLKATKTPLSISRFELANVQPPEVIVSAQEAAKEREIGIQKVEAEAQAGLVRAEKALEIAKKDRLVEREKAEAIAEQNRIAADSITSEVLAYKQLETALEIVKHAAANGNTVFLPIPTNSGDVSALTDSAVLAKLLGKELK